MRQIINSLFSNTHPAFAFNSLAIEALNIGRLYCAYTVYFSLKKTTDDLMNIFLTDIDIDNSF